LVVGLPVLGHLLHLAVLALLGVEDVVVVDLLVLGLRLVRVVGAALEQGFS
jgi:hydrogenase/urease accessory protein HupE